MFGFEAVLKYDSLVRKQADKEGISEYGLILMERFIPILHARVLSNSPRN